MQISSIFLRRVSAGVGLSAEESASRADRVHFPLGYVKCRCNRAIYKQQERLEVYFINN